MRASRDFAYAQARLQARHGERLQDGDWRTLEAARSLRLHLERARATALRRHCERLDAALSGHALEAVLRREAERAVHEVAAWLPPHWRPAVLWLAHLPVLPLLDAALRGERLPEWAADEPVLAPLVGLEPSARAAVLANSPAAPLVPSFGDETTSVADLWVAEWGRRLPGGVAANREIGDLIEAVRRAATANGTTLAHQDLPTRAAIERILARAFRAGAGTALAAIAHLGLLFVDLERLRGGILRRALFDGTHGEEAA
jgi:hypothetical protein